MNHCFMKSFSASQQLPQAIDKERPHPIHSEQINCEKNYRHECDQRRVLNHVRAWPGHATHLSTSVVQKLNDAREESRTRGSLLWPPIAAAGRKCVASDSLRRHTSWSFRSLNAGHL